MDYTKLFFRLSAASVVSALVVILLMGFPSQAQDSLVQSGAVAVTHSAPPPEASGPTPVACYYGSPCMINEGQQYAEWFLGAYCTDGGQPVDATVDLSAKVSPAKFTLSFDPKTAVIAPGMDPSYFTMMTPAKVPAGTYTITAILTPKSGPCKSYPFNPPTTTLQVLPAYPINFHQAGISADAGGVLSSKYAWDSSSGDLSDLSECQVGEYVTYPGSGDNYIWPDPPYEGSSPNPTTVWFSADKGVAYDNQKHADFKKPYAFNTFTAIQAFRYQCPSIGIVEFPGFTGITIVRTVADNSGQGCYGYTVSKLSFSASVYPLPGDPSDCNKASPEQVLDFKNDSKQIDVSVSLPEASVSLNEPIFFDLTVSNRLAEMVQFDLGLNSKTNLDLTISSPTGDVINRRLSLPVFGSSGEFSLAPGQAFVERLLLNEWSQFPSIGTYGIKVTLFDGDGVVSANSPSTQFSVQTGSSDPARLKLISQHLADSAIAGAALKEKIQAANALSYVVDPVAVDSLVRVLQQGSIVGHYAVEGLARIGNPEAIAALVAARNNPDEDVRTAVRYSLGVLQGRAQ
jgi:PBS lyase HEAT-like repeat